MGDKTSIQWCDSTVNPIMGCNGCELYPKASEVLRAIDAAVAVTGVQIDSEAILKKLVDHAFEQIDNPLGAHKKAVNNTNIWHLRDQPAALSFLQTKESGCLEFLPFPARRTLQVLLSFLCSVEGSGSAHCGLEHGCQNGCVEIATANFHEGCEQTANRRRFRCDAGIGVARQSVLQHAGSDVLLSRGCFEKRSPFLGRP